MTTMESVTQGKRIINDHTELIGLEADTVILDYFGDVWQSDETGMNWLSPGSTSSISYSNIALPVRVIDTGKTAPQMEKGSAYYRAVQRQNLIADLVKRRIQKGISEEKLAQELGVSLGTLQELESYDDNPSLETLLHYANTVGAKLVASDS